MTAPRRPEVVVVCKHVHRFRERFFELLREEFEEHGITMRLLYGLPTASEAAKENWCRPQWGELVRNRELRLGGSTAVWQSTLRATRSADLVVLEQASRLLVNYIYLAKLAPGRPRVALWGHGVNRNLKVNRVGEAIKAVATARADWFFGYTDSSRSIVVSNGFDHNRVTVLENTIDTVGLRADLDRVTDDDRLELRHRLGIGDDPFVLALGALYTEKQPEVLVEIADALHDRRPRVHVVVAGGGPDAGVVIDAARSRSWLHYLGPTFGPPKAVLLDGAEAMLVPGVAGLVVVDAMSAGLPIVVARRDDHPPEIDYVQHGTTGLIVSGGADALAEALAEVIDDRNLRRRMADATRLRSASLTLEAMAQRFVAGAELALR